MTTHQSQRKAARNTSIVKKHGNLSIRGRLELTIRLTDVPWLHRGTSFLGRIKQTSLPLALLLVLACPILGSSTTNLLVIFSFFDFQGLLCQGLHDLKGKETKNVDDIVIGFRLSHDTKPCPFAETLALPVGE